MIDLYSAVIIAKNEERTIGDCLDSLLQITNDIVVVLDDRTTDNTEKIALSKGARTYKISWQGFSANKNYGVLQTKNDWILCPDADEILEKELIASLKSLSPNIHEIYEFNIQTYFGDYAVKYCGWYPDWNIRLYNKNISRWNDSQVHEKLISSQKLKPVRVNGLVKHLSFKDELHMQEKFDYYAKLRASEWIRSKKQPNIFKQLLGPGFRFFRTYILKLGILDGIHGYTIAKNEYLLKQKELHYWKALRDK